MTNDADEPGATPITELSINLRIGVSRLSRRIRAEKAAEDISDTQYTALTLLFRDGPHTIGELSDAERVKPPSMNRTVNCLVDAGYAERTSAPDDGRKVVVQATATGRALVTETRRRRNAWLVGRLEELTPEQRDMLTEAAVIIRELADS
ncbi:MarR family winged helix-turn-helix transcriptional regulator [Leifsonia sp. Root112D2]|uniref:MarR family winged helix-turn-helix transcriptional regulator n=1 Tax=Leifsonia sp. Root112D2 TaxID=1736426 RepID=UPI0007006740|nr:MarR family transcriptional regulator [Leifsonia sp. Root112D2]KQV06501.1 MarR family transcriptional regulator [Leifsonia sp. Root112D2]